MRVVIFSWRGPGHPNEGGAEIVTHEHAKAWVKAGHEVTLFTSYYRGSRKEELLDGVKIIRRGNAFIGVRLEAFQWYMGLRQKPDLVIDQFHGIPFFTPLFVKGKKLGFIHEVAKEVWWLNHLVFPLNFIYAVVGFFSEPLVFWLLYRDIPFMTVSESTKNDLVRWGIPRKKTTVIHNGVSVKKVFVEKEKKKTALFLGALSKDKGIEGALKVFALINRSQKDWQYWVVGKGEADYLKKLQHLAKGLRLRKKVKFWGYVSEKEKFELLARAHVMVNTSVREGWGLVNIEANSVGTPVVAYDVPGCRDSVGEGVSGFLCKAGDRQCLAELATLLTKNSSKFSRTCKSWASRFSWEKSTKESKEFIESL